MKRFVVLPLGAMVLLIVALTWAGDDRPTVKIASFNILRLGQDGYDAKKDWDKTAAVLVQFDMVSLLEVIREDAVVGLLAKIEAYDGQNWEYIITDPIGRTSYKECYCFIWRDQDVDLLDDPQGIYPDESDAFEREPFWATFRADQFDFTLIAMHSIYGDRKADRQAEARLLDDVFNYVQDLEGSVELDVILMGDFNLDAGDSAWDELRGIESAVALFDE